MMVGISFDYIIFLDIIKKKQCYIYITTDNLFRSRGNISLLTKYIIQKGNL